ncbi:hypothetical protein ES703_55911 [subsurface metagenome]
MTVYINGVADVISLQDVKDNVKLNELQAPDGAVAMGSQKITGMAAAVAQGDAIAADANVRAPNATQLQGKTPGAASGIATLSAGSVVEQDPKAHAIGGTKHTSSTLANLSSKVSDATVCSETEADNKIAAAAKGLAIFGDGSDGDVDINGGAFSSGPITNNSLTRDAFFDNLTLSGGDLNCAGYRLFCKGTLTIDASYKVHRTGNKGGNGSSSSSGAGGAGLGAGSLGGSVGGGCWRSAGD